MRWGWKRDGKRVSRLVEHNEDLNQSRRSLNAASLHLTVHYVYIYVYITVYILIYIFIHRYICIAKALHLSKRSVASSGNGRSLDSRQALIAASTTHLFLPTTSTTHSTLLLPLLYYSTFFPSFIYFFYFFFFLHLPDGANGHLTLPWGYSKTLRKPQEPSLENTHR